MLLFCLNSTRGTCVNLPYMAKLVYLVKLSVLCPRFLFVCGGPKGTTQTLVLTRNYTNESLTNDERQLMRSAISA